MGKGIEIKASWSNVLDSGMEEDFILVENEVFGNFCTKSFFERKYLKNIYGPSVLVVAYLDGNPIGADALWRNDIDGLEAYQSADTCVLGSYRGMGIFTKMIEAKLSLIQSDALIYGFPNSNSLHGFIKMGWSEVKLYKTISFFNSSRKIGCIDNSYVGWWIQFQGGITHLKRRGCYYLVRKRKGKLSAMVIGQVEEKTALLFAKTSGLFFLKFFASKPSFYNKSLFITTIFAKKPKEIVVPYWKIDAV